MTPFRIDSDDKAEDVIATISFALRAYGLKIVEHEAFDGFIMYHIVNGHEFDTPTITLEDLNQ